MYNLFHRKMYVGMSCPKKLLLSVTKLSHILCQYPVPSGSHMNFIHSLIYWKILLVAQDYFQASDRICEREARKKMCAWPNLGHYSSTSPKGTEENHKKTVRIGHVLARIQLDTSYMQERNTAALANVLKSLVYKP
jgi:hypothetical protein